MGPGFKHWNSFRTLFNAVHFLCPSQFSWLRLIADKGPKHLFFLVVEPWVESIWFPIKKGHLPAPFVRLETSRLLFLLSSLVLPDSHACSINQQTLLFFSKARLMDAVPNEIWPETIVAKTPFMIFLENLEKKWSSTREIFLHSLENNWVVNNRQFHANPFLMFLTLLRLLRFPVKIGNAGKKFLRR